MWVKFLKLNYIVTQGTCELKPPNYFVSLNLIIDINIWRINQSSFIIDCEIINIILLHFSCLNLSKEWVKLSPKHLKKNHHFHLIPTFQTSQLQVSPNYSFLRFLHMNILYLMSKIWSCRKQHFHLGYNITQQSVHLCKIVERFLRICSIRCNCRNLWLFVIAEKKLSCILILNELYQTVFTNCY